ncbi:MAG: metallophosphoesterase [Planctomycetes bacterium]|nr:metallophosphoesterase [Planctomycetota bacterium]
MLGSACVLVLVLLGLPAAALVIGAARLWVWRARKAGRLSGPVRLVERRWVWGPATAVLGATTLAVFYAFLVEPDWVEVTRVEVSVSRPLCGRPRLRIVHLSDLHLEGIGRRERAVIEAVRAQAPDLIVLTGDYLNERRAQNDLVAFLQALEAPMGVYGVGGNWDGKWPIEELFRSGGAVFLRDDWRRVGEDVLLIGQDYRPTRSVAELLDGASEGPYRVFLQHSPDAVDELARARVDLFLCGHTHGGQVRLPLWGAIATMTAQGKRYEQGRYDLGAPVTMHPNGTVMYVNRGIGMTAILPHVRFLARPEVTVIDLVSPIAPGP